jgi:anti-sigma B factor antagonist
MTLPVSENSNQTLSNSLAVEKIGVSTTQVLTPTGAIFSATSTAYVSSWVEQSLKDGSTDLLIDLSNVTFMDSTGLRNLVVAFKTVKAVGGTLSLCSLGEQTQMLLSETDTDQLFPIYRDRQAFYQHQAST